MNRAVIAVVVAVFAFAGTFAKAQTRSVEAIIGVWEGAGMVFAINETQAYFVGGVTGTVFADDAQGLLREADFTCPGTIYVDVDSGGQEGSGHCIFRTPSGESIFADWACEGAHGVGCAGPLTLTGGTGERTGSSGSGTMILRGSLDSRVIASAGGAPVEAARGLIIIHDLTVTTSE